MRKFRVIWTDGSPSEEVDASGFSFAGKDCEWIEFADGGGTVVMVRSRDVSRVERVL